MTVVKRIQNGAYGNTIHYSHANHIAFNMERRRLTAMFRVDLAEEYNVAGHLKEDALFKLAWEYGHASGYTEVAECYEKFAELISLGAEAG